MTQVMTICSLNCLNAIIPRGKVDLELLCFRISKARIFALLWMRCMCCLGLRHKPGQWISLLSQCCESGVSERNFCVRHLMIWWRKKEMWKWTTFHRKSVCKIRIQQKGCSIVHNSDKMEWGTWHSFCFGNLIFPTLPLSLTPLEATKQMASNVS